MSESDRKKWDQRYRDGSYRARIHPTVLLQHWLPELPRGRALDVACGTGRNALYLAAQDYQVDAVDISPYALAQGREKAQGLGLAITWTAADLDSFVPQPDGYDLVVVARYVNRRLMPRLGAALKPGGALVYEHHLLSEQPVDGPKDPDFRLAPGELREQFANLREAFYYEGAVKDPDGRNMALAQMVAFRPGNNAPQAVTSAE